MFGDHQDVLACLYEYVCDVCSRNGAGKAVVMMLEKRSCASHCGPSLLLQNFYTVHGDDATMISSEYYKTTVGVNSMGAGSNTLTSFSVNPRAFDEIVPDLLLRRGMAVEVWAASGKVGGWECSRKGSPGHLDSFEDLVLGVSGGCDTGVVASVKILSASNQKVVVLVFTPDSLHSPLQQHFFSCRVLVVSSTNYLWSRSLSLGWELLGGVAVLLLHVSTLDRDMRFT